MRTTALCLLLLTGCVRIRLAALDREAGRFTLCGSRAASVQALDEYAQRMCHVPVHPRQCGEQAYGAVAASPYRSGIAVANTLYGMCCEYQCTHP